MRTITKAVALAAMLAFPIAASAQTTPATKPAPAMKSSAAKSSVATKTTSGVVKSVSDSSLVITTGSGAKATDKTFTVNAQTTKKGTIAEGSKVSVHYKTEGTDMVATAVTAAPAKKASSKK